MSQVISRTNQAHGAQAGGNRLAVNFWLAEMLGVDFDVALWPYSQYRRDGVEALRKMVKVDPVVAA